MKQSYSQISFAEINDSEVFNIHPFLHNELIPFDLSSSYQAVGILSPPVLLKKAEGNYDVICGRKRLQFLSTVLKEESCCCRILPQFSPVEEILLIIVEDQFAVGTLSIIEQAWFMKLCHVLLPNRKHRRALLSSISVDRITKGTHFLLPLTEMHPTLQLMIHKNILSEKIITELLMFENQDQLVFAHLVENLKMGGNQQKKLIVQLLDIVKRDGDTLTALLHNQKITAILESTDINNPQKCRKLFDQILRMSQPLSISAKESFAAEVKDLSLPSNCSLTASQSFEKDEVILSIRYKNIEECRKALKKLGRSFN